MTSQVIQVCKTNGLHVIFASVSSQMEIQIMYRDRSPHPLLFTYDQQVFPTFSASLMLLENLF